MASFKDTIKNKNKTTQDLKDRIQKQKEEYIMRNPKHENEEVNKLGLTRMTKSEVLCFIRGVLLKDGKKQSFDMSGYDNNIVGDCTLYNQSLLNKFAFLGIYDYTKFLFLDFHKGQPYLHYEYWNGGGKAKVEDDQNMEMSAMTTSNMIYHIFKLTVFSGKRTRRRG